MSKKKVRSNILIVGNLHSNPSTKAFLDKFVNIIKEISNVVYVISGDKPPDYKNALWTALRINPEGNKIKRLLVFLKSQLKLLIVLVKNRLYYYDTVIILPELFVFPTLLLRFAKKKVALFVDGKSKNAISIMLNRLNFILANLLTVESENVVRIWKLRDYRGKIIDGSLYVDTDLFKKKKEIWERNQIVGYIGRLSKEKGFLNFVQMIPKILEGNYKIKFLIGGDGPLRDDVKRYLNEEEFGSKVEYVGWIPHSKLPNYLNELKLLVLPSYTEGLPNIVLEAMACNTPVLATPVGAIPDLIVEGETGFIMENNSNECIIKNIIRVLNHPNLEKIAENGRRLMEQKFTFEKAIERWRKILSRG